MWYKNKITQGIVFVILLAAVGLAFVFVFTRAPSDSAPSAVSNTVGREPIMISSHAAIEFQSLDDLIRKSDLIVRGKVSAINPSRWNTNDGNLPDTITIDSITADFVIYTDMVFEPSAILKGTAPKDQLVIRVFGGNVGKDSMILDAEQLALGQEYVIFLSKDTGSTAQFGPDHYIVFGATQGVYEIKEDRAITQIALRGEQQRKDPTQPRDDKALAGLSIDDLVRHINQTK